jgi:hypothetical protein
VNSVIEEILDSSTSETVGSLLQQEGWTHIGTSNWSDVYGSPAGDMAARIAPFDPAHVLFIEVVGALPDNPWIPHRTVRRMMADGAMAVVMERLRPAPAARAEALVAAIALPNDVGTKMPELSAEIAYDDPGVVALRHALERLQAEGKARYPVWGGSSLTREKVMADSAGKLKLTNPAFISGPRLIEAILTGNERTMAAFTREELLRFPKIPYFLRDIDRRMEARQLTAIIEQINLPAWENA